jgi:hypothetical protein
MTLHTAILINGVLDFGVVVALAATLAAPFALDRRKDGATVYAFAAPLPDDIADELAA